jgi:hypothetical protein
LAGIIQQPLVREKMVNGRCRATDTTAQEKPLAYPTDSALLEKGRRQGIQWIGAAKAAGVARAQGWRSFT